MSKWTIAADEREHIHFEKPLESCDRGDCHKYELTEEAQIARNDFTNAITVLDTSFSYHYVTTAACNAVFAKIADNKVYESVNYRSQYLKVTHDWRLAFTKADNRSTVVVYMFPSNHKNRQKSYDVKSNAKSYRDQNYPVPDDD